MDDEGIKKYFVKNKYNLVFSILTLVALIFFIFSVSKLDLKLSLLNQILGLFSSGMWFGLFLSLGISSTLAYFEKLKWVAVPVFIWLLIFTVQVRTSNVSDLIDVTTGNYTLGPDLDPFLYLRHAGEILQGNVPAVDPVRYAPVGATNYATTSLMPWVIVGVYKLISIFTNQSLNYAAIITPVILFIISMIGFFLFTREIFSLKIGKNKSSIIALIASIFYAMTPSMLHRTTGGIPEIESLGMAFFWFAFLFFTLAWKTEDKKKWIIYGIVAGLFTGLMSWSWGGYRYIYMILSMTAFVMFFLGKDFKKNFIIFVSWMIPALIIEFTKWKTLSSLIGSIPSTGFAWAVLGLMILQLILTKTKLINKLRKINLPENVKVMGVGILLAIIALLIIDPKKIIEIPSTIVNGLLYPYGKARISLTVAENKAPYLADVVSQFSYVLWVFLVSTVVLFYNSIKHFDKKDRTKLLLSFVVFIACIVFSRISETNMFNGDNVISKIVFFGGFLIFIWAILSVYISSYKNKNEKVLEDFRSIDFAYIMLIAFSFWTIISMRGAVRLFFIVAPMMILVASPLPIKFIELRRKSKDELLKLIFVILLILTILGLLYSCLQYTASTISEAKGSVPGVYEQQWQYAMSWVRDNTPVDSVFVHWWDYGYWVQTIGERPTVTDGGHFIEYWDHLTGRYLLTTTNPLTALSFMKAHDVSYLLIDSTDLGKYSAFSSIGSDESGNDRLSWIPVIPVDSTQTKETSNGTIRVYRSGSYIDGDITYTIDGKKIFLPSGKAALIGIILETGNEDAQVNLKQPRAVYYYNGQQYEIPLRYVYFNGELLDFKTGLNSAVQIIPSLGDTSVDRMGAVIYLSEKTKDSLFVQLYLMNDPLNKYSTVKLAHSEDDIIIKSLEQQGFNIGEFIYYGGFRGPVKIWKVGYSSNILGKEEFLRTSGSYAEFDNLTFTK